MCICVPGAVLFVPGPQAYPLHGNRILHRRGVAAKRSHPFRNFAAHFPVSRFEISVKGYIGYFAVRHR